MYLHTSRFILQEMSDIPNPEIELAYQFIQYTNTNVFLTGKAGTGKTTFLHRIQRESVKRMAVVAPTGVAAINAKGMTIHSLFQLSFGAFVPGSKASQQRKFSRHKIALLRSLDLLIIDEISMVRADLLDAIDEGYITLTPKGNEHTMKYIILYSHPLRNSIYDWIPKLWLQDSAARLVPNITLPSKT